MPVLIEGFTDAIPQYMYISDFFIGKPGPGCISEALAMNLPVIVERNARTLPQERYNIDWILEHQAGIVVPSFRRITEAVNRLIDSSNMQRYRASAQSINNRAVFEIPGVLASILETTPHRHLDTRSPDFNGFVEGSRPSC